MRRMRMIEGCGGGGEVGERRGKGKRKVVLPSQNGKNLKSLVIIKLLSI